MICRVTHTQIPVDINKKMENWINLLFYCIIDLYINEKIYKLNINSRHFLSHVLGGHTYYVRTCTHTHVYTHGHYFSVDDLLAVCFIIPPYHNSSSLLSCRSFPSLYCHFHSVIICLSLSLLLSSSQFRSFPTISLHIIPPFFGRANYIKSHHNTVKITLTENNDN
jgi:hypothetical protein